MSCMDVKGTVMTLIEYHKLFFKTLSLKIDHNELEEFFFWIIEHYCKVNRMKYILNPEYQIHHSQKSYLFKAIHLLEKNMPIQYVIGVAEFMGLNFFLNQNVLIPRPETEELVSWILSDLPPNKSILDIGTGSGCIAVSLAKFSNSCNVTAWDIDNKILDIARSNALKNKVKALFEIQDISSIKSNRSFDVIVSNPPYITLDEKKIMKKNVLLYEPHKALFVKNENPLYFYQKIIEFAKGNLNNNGNIFFEINELMLEGVSKLLNKEGFYDIEHKNDFRSKNRMIKARI